MNRPAFASSSITPSYVRAFGSQMSGETNTPRGSSWIAPSALPKCSSSQKRIANSMSSSWKRNPVKIRALPSSSGRMSGVGS